MKISLKVDYACRVLVQLVRWYGRSELPHIEDLAGKESIPANYLVQILNDLRSSGLVNSRRGKQGGYALAKPPTQINLADIVKAMDGEVIDFTETPGGESGQRVARAWREVVNAFEDKAQSLTLDAIARADGQEMYYI